MRAPRIFWTSSSLLVVLVFALASMRLSAQTKSARPAFEVASIHIVDPHSHVDHNDPSQSPPAPTFPANRWTMQFMQMKSLLCESFPEVDCSQIVGGPDWLRTNEMHYDITAKVGGSAMLTKDQMRPMVRTMLEDRFHLVFHREHRIVNGYALVVAKGGSKLTPHKDVPSSSEFMGAVEFMFHNISAKRVADFIGYTLKQPVVDKTGLTGMYDVDLKFAAISGPLQDDPRFSNLPSIFTAVQEQLGLKLIREKVSGEYIVIDHVDKIPTAN